MFGQDDTKDDTQNGATTIEPTTDDTAALPVVDDSTDAVADVVPSDTETEATETPVVTDEQEPAETTDEPETASVTPVEVDEPVADDTPAEAVEETTPPANNDELLELKKEALTDLGPLVSHLDQTPEEHFKTTMMLIQATDNATFVKEAYESAKKISDDAVRAQALLDIVNEINYFTQKHTD
ncbi:hypothetical protein KA047_03415 [Candidatus Saccharibacteria bacterium]|nr:hypothetical protein [Candidatus Saccharibacteria bacterium]